MEDTDRVNEGDACRDHSCIGFYTFPEIENCTCHISPPCGACLDAQLICTDCKMTQDEAEEE